MASTYHYHHPQPVWPPSHFDGFPAMYWTPPNHAGQAGEVNSWRERINAERRETLRRVEQIRADEELAMRMQREEEHLLLLDSTRSAEADYGPPIVDEDTHRQRRMSTSTRPCTPHSRRSRRSQSPVVEPFIPPPSTKPSQRSPTSKARRASAAVNDPAPSKVTSSVLTPAQQLRECAHIFTRALPCSRCGNDMFIQPMVDVSVGKQLHLTCEKCPKRTAHCRGCAKAVGCRRDCDALHSDCRLITCCRKGRAIAIFEILSLFDKYYTSAAEDLSKSSIWPVPKAERDDFLRLATSNSDSRLTRPFNTTLSETLAALQTWLPLEHSVHSSVPLLLSTSFILEVVRAYLKDATGGLINWVVYGELYTEILSLLKLLGRQECHHELVMGSLPTIHRSSGLHSWVWDAQSEWSADCTGGRKSLYSIADAKDIRAQLGKLGKKLLSEESREFVTQFSMDLNHIVCMNVLN
ncbi:hypothetical protein D9615_000916 [Tricholomella constricta]|uniref:Uncharacterized protein n=1 Tax=Tricholomella constricta TaxID=117010 RepID=A0A8H5M8H5_9AGAR|nr:hypothetical protein D9615_000916 [Tricholomella constricta]